jgi:hypothetical protein
MTDFNKYEKACKEIRKENKKLLEQFAEWLKQKKITDKTISKHVSNINFYINEFLLYEDAVPAKKGTASVDMFLGYWFIKKAMWASKSAIKENATSLKKFYQFMFDELGMIEKDDLSFLKEGIKENMPSWIEKIEAYDNPFVDEIEW